MKNEPALTIGAATVAVSAVLYALVEFGVDLSDRQITAVLTVVTTVAPLVQAWLTRRKVTPSGGQ